MTKNLILFIFVLLIGTSLKAQKIDSICFHLYTDSLKKGQHNYINVDAHLSNGRWQPMTENEVTFSCAEATFDGVQLIIPQNFSLPSVKVIATLKSNPTLAIEKVIWIKTIPDPILKKNKLNVIAL